MIKVLKKLKHLILQKILPKESEKNKVLLAQNIALNKRSLKSIYDFRDIEFSCFSQYGEDGIIDWLVSKLPMIPKKFVEFGVEDYYESNTRLLLQLHNWQGLIIDGSNDFIKEIKAQDITWRHHVDAICAHITKENINSLLEQNGMTGDIGLLSIDIDGNDYHVWQSIDVINPAIVVIEYNAVFGDLHQVTVPYRPDFFRTKAHFSNLYFGASLQALILLGKEKGYKFVGTNTIGANAFFIRDDLAQQITSQLDSISAYPSVFREARDHAGKLLLLGGYKRSEMIKDIPLFDIKNKETTSIKKLGEIYSSSWRNGKKNIL
tara:strand:+ start:304 stop:1263 length:960 start_codon:yes stop_codon:yes gene_type:complete